MLESLNIHVLLEIEFLICNALIKLFGIGVWLYYTAEPYGKDSLKLMVIRLDVYFSDAVRFQSLREACFML